MFFKLKILSVLLVALLLSLPQSEAECNVCSAVNSVACVSQTQYQVCVNNVPSGTVNACPNNYICSTTTAAICQASTTGAALACDNCNTCDSTLTFACTGVNTYSLCLGSTIPSTTLVSSCGANLVCNLNNPQICGDPATGQTPTCPTANPGTVAPTAAPTNPTPPLPYAQQWCQQVRINSRFALPAGIGNNCKQYIYCFRTVNAVWSGQIYTCAGSTYYDDYSKYCTATAPTGC